MLGTRKSVLTPWRSTQSKTALGEKDGIKDTVPPKRSTGSTKKPAA